MCVLQDNFSLVYSFNSVPLIKEAKTVM